MYFESDLTRELPEYRPDFGEGGRGAEADTPMMRESHPSAAPGVPLLGLEPTARPVP